VRRPVDKLLEDISLAADVADEIVQRGRDHFETDLVTQFGAEAVVGRIGDAASKLPEEVRASMPGLPWRRSSASASSWTTHTTGWTTAASGTRCRRTSRDCVRQSTATAGKARTPSDKLEAGWWSGRRWWCLGWWKRMLCQAPLWRCPIL